MTNRVLHPDAGRAVRLGPLGVRFMLGPDQTGGGFSLVEHPLAPRGLGAPMHVHKGEDEYSYVLEGEVGVQIGDDVVMGRPGDLISKPRGIWHAFWNAGDEPARLLEIISPSGFEGYFAELAPLLPPDRPEPDFAAIAALQARYGIEMDMSSIERLTREHGLAEMG
jgi:quercetin dioxygenase-like cupin family protein